MTRKRITGQTIRKKAFANELEVEHLLRAAHSPSTSLADELDELARELDWRFEAEFPEVP